MDVIGRVEAVGERNPRVPDSGRLDDRQGEAVAIDRLHLGAGAEPSTAEGLGHEQNLVRQLVGDVDDEVGAQENEWIRFGTCEVGRTQPTLVPLVIGEADARRLEPEPRPVERLDGGAKIWPLLADVIGERDLLDSRHRAKIALDQESVSHVHRRACVASTAARMSAQIRDDHHGNAGSIGHHRDRSDDGTTVDVDGGQHPRAVLRKDRTGVFGLTRAHPEDNGSFKGSLDWFTIAP